MNFIAVLPLIRILSWICPLYERAQSQQYDAQKVDFLFDAQSKEENRTAFAVMLHDDVIGEVELKHIDADHKTCELSIHMQNDSVKNKGYGTAAHYEGIREHGTCPIHRMTFLKNLK